MSELNRALGSAGVGVTMVLDQKEAIEDLQELIDEKTAELAKSKEAVAAVTVQEPPSQEYLDAKAVADAHEKELVDLNEAMVELRETPTYTVTVMPMNAVKRAAFEEWLEEGARASARKSARGHAKEARALRKELEAKEGSIDKEERGELVSEIVRLEQLAATASSDVDAAIASKEYVFSGEKSRNTSVTLPGLARIFLLMAKDKHPQLTQENCEEIIALYHAQILKGIREANDLGKKTKRALKL